MAPIMEKLTELQRRVLAALADGELCAETAALKSGYVGPSASAAVHRPAVWWGRVASGMPPGLIEVRWCLLDKRHYYRLTPVGKACALSLDRGM